MDADEDSVRAGYDAVAEAYAARFFGELLHKPLDRALLQAFLEQLPPGGMPVADVGCGPAHVARHLGALGATVLGIDLSPAMVDVARRLSPGLDVRLGTMLALDAADDAWAGIVAFYSIIHLEPADVPVAFGEFSRVLRPGGLVLLAYHAGEEVRHVDSFLGKAVSMDFRFHEPAAVSAALQAAGFEVLMSMERRAYEPFEVATRRAYVMARKAGPPSADQA
jgi:SAM-dependent methyltransferase